MMRQKKLLAITLYIVMIHVLLVFAVTKSDFLSRVRDKVTTSHAVEAELTPYYYQMLKFHKRMDNNVPDRAIIFIGDSLLQGIPVSAIYFPSVNYSIGGDTTYGVLQRISNYRSLDRASMIVIAIGLNDIKIRSNEEILNNYKAIIDKIPKAKPIILSAILPIDERSKKKWKNINSDRIKTLNKNIKTIAENETRIRYIDAGPLLVDASENLSAHLHIGDGVHLNTEGNNIWIRSLKSALGYTN